MIESPAELAMIAVARYGASACRELRNELADAAHSSRFDDAQAYLTAARIVCGGSVADLASLVRIILPEGPQLVI